ncbi:autotransporter assembly complex family protein [Amaricoccus sp.]|uniref:autotransporter assembly complex protein TamA n=1 Tax=Amaricoccus sp. TaxID=1872485 RepID=UPI001B3FD938|nr:autotransporter assembly complex family protein [Amaricoccus sp.]MBP7001066.1 outer membrane protein assembly factor [Amaricoccus sp.]
MAIAATAPAQAFSLFGIHLWGEREDQEAGFEIIDPLAYDVQFVVTGGDGGLEAQLKNASGLWAGRDKPASGVGGLLSRSRGDYRRLLAALYNQAYYGPEISIRLAGQEAADLTLDARLPRPTPVVVAIRPGPRFKFGQAVIVNPPPREVAEDDEVDNDLGDDFRTGADANAAIVAAASSTAIERWRQLSRAKARETDRSVTADHPTSKLDVVITLDPGRPARFGRTSVSGTQRVDPGFVAYMADLTPGDSFDPDRVKAAEDRLARLGVFSSIRVEEAPEIAPDGTLDMAVRLQDGTARTLGVGATLSTIEGAGVEAFWEHRNLFHRAERLRFSASVTGLGVVGDVGDFDYEAGVTFTRPGVINPNVDFFASLTGRRLDLDTYREESLTARFGLQRTYARWLNGEISAFATRARFDDFFGIRRFLMFGVTGKGTYDRRDDVMDPTRGYYLAAEAEPFYEAEYGNAAARGTLEGRIYHGFGEERRFVLAARAKAGSFVGPSDRESPPDKLFFAGGAGSIRGYAYRSVGVDYTEPDGDTGVVGGRSLVEGSGEARFRINDRFGAVGFVDAGFVSASSSFTSDDTDVRVGAGAGLRYFTGLGPIRLDVATPINPRDDDDVVAFYVGIGQAF